nr:unnamed protein product [Callosobruchus chinensis]
MVMTRPYPDALVDTRCVGILPPKKKKTTKTPLARLLRPPATFCSLNGLSGTSFSLIHCHGTVITVLRVRCECYWSGLWLLLV